MSSAEDLSDNLAIFSAESVPFIFEPLHTTLSFPSDSLKGLRQHRASMQTYFERAERWVNETEQFLEVESSSQIHDAKTLISDLLANGPIQPVFGLHPWYPARALMPHPTLRHAKVELSWFSRKSNDVIVCGYPDPTEEITDDPKATAFACIVNLESTNQETDILVAGRHTPPIDFAARALAREMKLRLPAAFNT
jgi:hypothetical protein